MKIFVQNLEFEGFHGVYEEERRDGRRFQIDLEVTVDAQGAAESDDLAQTLDYRRLAEIVDEVAHGPSRFLVEKLAAQIVDLALSRYPQVEEATVRIRKHATGVVGNPQWVGVELTRRRGD